MKSLYINPPKLLRKIYPDVIWENYKDEVLLTFDDGPSKDLTLNILNHLRTYNAKAIFFLVGKDIEKNYDFLEKICEQGHYVANHSFSHSKSMIFFDRNIVIEEIKRTDDLLSKQKNHLKIFRPPYGRLSFRVKNILKSLNHKVMMWTLLTEDYLGDYELVKKNIENYLKSNSIVVFHNNKAAGKIINQSLDYLFSTIEKRGYKIGNVIDF